MKISRIILKGVNNFEDFDHSFEDEWTQSVPDSLLLLGPNGSGKTTILRSMMNLWYLLGAYLNHGEIFLDRTPNFAGCKLAAIEIRDIEIRAFLAKPLWIYVGQKQVVDHFLSNREDCYIIGSIWKNTDRGLEAQPYLFFNEERIKTTELPDWVKALNNDFLANSLGSRSNLPNLIFFDSEQRTFSKIEEKFSVTPEKDGFNWLARYTASTGRKGSIENYLFTLKVIDEESYNRIVTGANAFFVDKVIAGFDPKTKELMVRTISGQEHPAYLLSSGEKQVLLMIAYITRELRPGGIVLIDEPDLHLHVSLSTAFVSYLKRMVAAQDGQLIIASHAPELWDRFTDAEKVRLGAEIEVEG